MQRIHSEVGGCELIIVDDGTPKDISKELNNIKTSIDQVKIISSNLNMGKGYAIRKGIYQASHELIIYTDIDFPYQHESFMSIYHNLQKADVDIAVGVKEKAYYDGVPFFRKYISKILRWMIKNLLSIAITDTQCGLKGFKKSMKHLWLEGTIDRYLFDLEMIYNAEQQGYQVKPIPVKLRPGVEFSQIKVSILAKELNNFLMIVWKSRWNKIRKTLMKNNQATN